MILCLVRRGKGGVLIPTSPPPPNSLDSKSMNYCISSISNMIELVTKLTFSITKTQMINRITSAFTRFMCQILRHLDHFGRWGWLLSSSALCIFVIFMSRIIFPLKFLFGSNISCSSLKNNCQIFLYAKPVSFGGLLKRSDYSSFKDFWRLEKSL